MTRPAMIIGLGGTGQQVLTFLKKELLEIGGGQFPEAVKLLAFDTASRVNDTGVVDDEKVYRLGNIMLDENKEYVSIGKNFYPLVQEILADKKRIDGHSAQLPHLHWFPAEELMRILPPAAFDVKYGVGTFRAIGRLCLFRNVYKILGHIEQALRDVQIEVNRITSDAEHSFVAHQPVEIIVVSSLAGSTGAGIFIDMAWLVRILANEILHNKYALRGFFLLPTTFTNGRNYQDPDADFKHGRGFAAWRELDRAMLGGDSGNRIVYDPSDPKLQIAYDKPVYDTTYLIDPLRDILPIHPPLEEGVFPAVAHLISFLLDFESGPQFARYLDWQVYGVRSELRSGVYHSAIGGYTLKVPVNYTQQQFSHKLAQQVLEVLLAPEKNQSGRVTHLSRPDRRKIEVDVHHFLMRDFLRNKDETNPNTKLLHTIGQHRAERARENPELIYRTAQGSLTTSLRPYFDALCLIPECGPLKDLFYTIAYNCGRELQWKIWDECPPRRKRIESSQAAWDRLTSEASFRSVPYVRKWRFGVELPDQAADQKLQGEFRSELEKPKAAQLTLFQKLLHAQTLQDLNGKNPDICVARSGKLGYVRAFYKELGESLAYFRGFLSDVQTHRSQVLKQKQVTRDAADFALKRYSRDKSKSCWMTFWDMNVHPDSDRACRNWLRAEQRDIDRRRGDILLEVLDETAAAMQTYVEKTLAEIDSWFTHLATGYSNFNIESLYARVTESLAGVEVNHALDQRLGNTNFQTERTLGKVSQIITEHTFQSDDQMLADALESIHWKTAPGEDGLKLQCNIEFPGASQDDPPDIRAFRRDGENPAGDNLRLLIRLTERPYYSVQHDYPLVKEISDVYPDGKSLANALHGHVEPFYRFRHGTVPPAVQQAFLRVNDENDAVMQDYFDVQFRSKFLEANPQLGGRLEIVSSDDRYKLTMVRSDDLMPSESFDQWHICFEPYQGMFANLTPREIHVFTAEQNAARYERAIPRKLKQNYRILRPEVVALLEDRRHFEMFFLAYAHGFIAKMSGGQDDVQPSIFEVIQIFLSGQGGPGWMKSEDNITWQELRQAITNHKQGLSRERCTGIYEAQMKDQPDGLVEAILHEGEIEKALPAYQRYRERAVATLQKYIDLADVAQLIFIEVIERLQQPTW